MTSRDVLRVLPCGRSLGCEQCLANTSCVYCQSTGKCLEFPVARLGIVSWSTCPPNLSTHFWYTCRLSYAYFLALAIAIFVFIGLLILLCVCALIIFHRRRRSRVSYNAATPDPTSCKTPSFVSYHNSGRLIRIGSPLSDRLESDRLLDSPQSRRLYGPA